MNQRNRTNLNSYLNALCFFVVIAFFVGVRDGVSAEISSECLSLAGPSVGIENIDAKKAISACGAALSAKPSDGELAFALGRALEKGGRIDDARSLYTWAVDLGFSKALDALEKIEKKEIKFVEGEKERNVFAAKLDDLSHLGTKIARSVKRDNFDYLSVIAQSDMQPESLLRWVRENTRLIPYQGMLRGPDGVLMDRCGNSLDRALLLGELITRIGQSVRVAHKILDKEALEKLKKSFLETKRATSNVANEVDKEGLSRLMQEGFIFSKEQIDSAIDKSLLETKRLQSEVAEMFMLINPAVLDILKDSVSAKEFDAEIENGLRDYYWIELRGLNGWEPLFLDEGIVAAKGETSETFSLDSVPYALNHSVTLRLFVETLQDGKSSEQKVLEKKFLAREFSGKPLALGHVLLPQPDIMQILKAEEPERALREAVSKAWVVIPKLFVGSESHEDQLFATDGRVLPSNLQSLAELGVAGSINVAKVLEKFGTLLDDGRSENKTNHREKAEVIAEWLEIEIFSPGRPVKVERRAIFDLLGPAERSGQAIKVAIDSSSIERRALALGGSIDIYIYGATPHRDWLTARASEAVASALGATARNVRKNENVNNMIANAQNERFQLALWGHAQYRSSSGMLPQAAPVMPNVSLFWQMLTSDTNGTTRARSAIDLLSNAAIVDGSIRNRISQGILDTAVEQALVSSDVPESGNAAMLFFQDLKAKKEWKLIKEPSSVDSLGLSENIRFRIKNALSEGFLIIAPQSPTELPGGAQQEAYWRVDPKTGDILGISSNGLGGAMAEYLTTHQIAFIALCSAFSIGCMASDGATITSGILLTTCLAKVPATKLGVAFGLLFSAFLDMVMSAATPGL